MLEPEVRNLAFIPRWTTVHKVQGQDDAQHSHVVAVYADQLAEYFKWNGDRAALIRYALWHDIGELASGDMPGPFKRRVVDEQKYTELVNGWLAGIFIGGEWKKPDDPTLLSIVKLADCIDEVLWVHYKSGPPQVVHDATVRMHAALAALPFSEEMKHHILLQMDVSISNIWNPPPNYVEDLK